MIEKKPFRRYRTDGEKSKEKRVVLAISLNLEEYSLLQEDMKTLEQPKDSTAIKTLWNVGRNVLHDPKTGLIMRSILGNLRRNQRIGITDASAEIDAKVRQNKPNM